MFTINSVQYQCKVIGSEHIVKNVCQDIETLEYRDVIDCLNNVCT